MIQSVVHFIEEHPFWSWLAIAASAALAWIAPIAGIVAIATGVLKAYIEWQKYKHWKKTNASSGS